MVTGPAAAALDPGVVGMWGTRMRTLVLTPKAKGVISMMWVSGPYTSMGTSSDSSNKGMALRPAVGTTATDVNFDLMVDVRCFELLKGWDDALEGSGNVGEVGNTITDDQDLSLGVWLSTSNEVKGGFGVSVCFTLSWCTRLFSVVGKLVSKAVGGGDIRVNNGSNGGTVELLNVSFFLSQATTERGWPDLHVGQSDLG